MLMSIRGLGKIVSSRTSGNSLLLKRNCSATFDTLREIKKLTSFGTAEIQSLYSQFQRRSGSDNQLDRNEFSNCLIQLGVDDKVLAEKSFDVFDTNKNGFVDFREFATGLSIITRGTAADKYVFAFQLWDTNKDGSLDKEEFRLFLKGTQCRNIDETLFESIWADLDKEAKGSVTFEQCRQGIAKYQLAVTPLLFEELLPNGMSKEEYEIISLLGERMILTKGEVITHQGAQEKFFYVILTGEVNISRNGITITSLSGIGETFGGESLLDLPSTKRVTCTSDRLTLLRMNVDDLRPLLYHSHIGATTLVQRASSKFMARLQEINILGLTHEAIGSDKSWIQLRSDALTKLALFYHTLGKNGKLEVVPTKSVGSAADLSVAYSPGVAEPCLAIKSDPDKIYDYTAKGHLVGVITNGTAVLGLGNIGAAASKPVMEGKAVLFKKFGGVDSFDIEVNESDPQKFIDIVVSLEPTFGGINIEDVKAPECFHIEREIQRRVSIPIMHDDQHGTAIVAGAGLINALQIIGKDISKIRVVVSGCGAAGFTCAKYFKSLGVQDLIALDIKGVIYKGRGDLKDPSNYLNEVAVDTKLRTLEEAITGADVFLGVSVGGLLKPEMLLKMNPNPIVFALANPTPEISYSLAKKTRPDVIIATGRSDYPNQINNVCAFPYIFRGAMDVRAKSITENIKLAATNAIAAIAQSDTQLFGRDYIIPKPFDPRLKVDVSSAVAAAAMATGIARLKLDLEIYKDILREEVTTLVM